MDFDPEVEGLDSFSLLLPLPYRLAILIVLGVWLWGLNLHGLHLLKIVGHSECLEADIAIFTYSNQLTGCTTLNTIPCALLPRPIVPSSLSLPLRDDTLHPTCSIPAPVLDTYAQ
jgi:hypothetical protein